MSEETIRRNSNKIARLEDQVERLEDALVQVHKRIVNPHGYKMAAPRKGPIAGIYRRVRNRDHDTR